MSPEEAERLLSRVNPETFLISPKIAERADRLVGGKGRTRQDAAHWINSSTKRRLDQILCGAFPGLACALPAAAVVSAVRIFSGPPAIHWETVGFVGENERVSVTKIPKIRSMVVGAQELQAQQEIIPSAFKVGLNNRVLQEDEFLLTVPGRIIRKTSLDEAPQIGLVALGRLSGIGSRAYTEPEMALTEALLQIRRNNGDLTWGFLKNYTEDMTRIRPKPAVFGLYRALGGKLLTFAERAMSDFLWLRRANIAGDLRTYFASVQAVLGKSDIPKESEKTRLTLRRSSARID